MQRGVARVGAGHAPHSISDAGMIPRTFIAMSPSGALCRPAPRSRGAGFRLLLLPPVAASARLNLDVDDMEAPEREVLALGAKALDLEDEGGRRGFRVCADPVGHPFCLIRPE